MISLSKNIIFNVNINDPTYSSFIVNKNFLHYIKPYITSDDENNNIINK